MDRILEILGLLESPSDLTDEQIGELEAELVELFTEVRSELDDASAEERPGVIESLTKAGDGIKALRTLAQERIAAAETAEAEAAAARAAEDELLARLEAEINAESEVEAEAEVEPEVEVEAVAEAEPEVEVEAEVEAVSEPEPVAASGATATAPLSQIGQATKPRQKAKPKEAARPRVSIRAAGTGFQFENRVQVEDALLQRQLDLAGFSGPDGRERVASFQAEFPKDRILPAGRITDVTEMALEVQAKVSEGGAALEALTADGGLCAPVNVWYDLQTIAQAGRPLRARVTNFNASRGGLTFDSPLTLADINVGTTPTSGNAIGVITDEQDAAGTYNKSHQMITCGEPTTSKVEAVYRILQIGNMLARTNQERVSQFTDLSVAAYARFAEQRLFSKMKANSRHTNAPQKYGAWRDWVSGLNRAAINYRARHRMDKMARLEIVAPHWVGMGLLPDDALNGLNAYKEQFEQTITDVESALSRIGLSPIWYEDDWTTALADEGALPAYPTSFNTLMYHPGAHVYVDNGVLDLGLVRDSVLNADNVYQTFVEEFWNTAMWGVESIDIEFSLCASGASAGSVAPHCGS